MLLRASLLALAASLLACGGGDDAADVSGDYAVQLTNRDNGCNLGNWEVDHQTTGVMVAVTQAGASVSVEVQGLAGAGLDFLLEGHVFTGDVSGDHLSATIVGTKASSEGACTYTLDAVLEADLDSNTLQGTVEYQGRTNASPDCGALTGCVSRMDFAGARPPQ